MEERRLAENFVGIDTHKDFHAVCVVDGMAMVVYEGTYEADPAGYARLADDLQGIGCCKSIAIEGTSGYGKGLCEFLQRKGYDVYEALRPGRRQYNPSGKTDAIDALAAAMGALMGQYKYVPKAHDGHAEELAYLVCARDSAVKEATAVNNAVQGLIVKAPIWIREKYGDLKGRKLMDALIRARSKQNKAIMDALKSMARRWAAARDEADALEDEMAAIVNTYYAPLIDAKGIGVLTASTLISAAGDNPERYESDAAFAKSLGACPIPASSGKNEHMRLNRGGNRAGNKALHQIVITRMSTDEDTKDYVGKKMREGKSKKDAIRCLKRFVAREVYRLLKECSTHQMQGGIDLKARRKGQGITQRKMADVLKTNVCKLSKIERGIIVDLDLQGDYERLLKEFEKDKKITLQT